MTHPLPPFATLASQEAAAMARRRLQQDGDLSVMGGWWRLRWRVDKIDADNNVVRGWSTRVTIGPAVKDFGVPALTQKQARRLAWDQYLSKLDQNQQTPQSMMTMDQFVERRFTPGHVKHRKKSGRSHYANMLKHVLPTLGKMRLCDVKKEHVQALVNAVLDSGRSWQTAKHIKNVVSAIFTFAEGEGCYSGINPAKHVQLGEEWRVRERHALTFDQAAALFSRLPETLADFCRALCLTSMNVAEAQGIRPQWVNLSGEWVYVDGEPLPPRHIGIRHQWYRGEFGSTKASARRRNIPICDDLAPILGRAIARGGEYVFCSGTGGPIDAHNQLRRVLKPAAAAMGLPWVSWHVFRHTHATWTATEGLGDSDRMRLMGHASLDMTQRYSHGDSERQREALNGIAAKLAGAGKPTPGKVVQMRRAG